MLTGEGGLAPGRQVAELRCALLDEPLWRLLALTRFTFQSSSCWTAHRSPPANHRSTQPCTCLRAPAGPVVGAVGFLSGSWM